VSQKQLTKLEINILHIHIVL